jgi:flagellar L-ring protein FlgH
MIKNILSTPILPRSIASCVLWIAIATLCGCAANKEKIDPLAPSAEFAPVFPLTTDRNKIATGGIYGNASSDAWFGRGRNFQVGDLITVLLNESTQSARTQNSNLDRKTINTALPTGFGNKLGQVPVLNGLQNSIAGAEVASNGTGQAAQQASLTGSIAVTVVEILSNGNLMVRGEKKLGLAEGTEVIQVSGVIRPQDIGPNDQVQSLRLANAQISYRGTGDLNDASKAGWGTSLMYKWWPF